MWEKQSIYLTPTKAFVVRLNPVFQNVNTYDIFRFELFNYFRAVKKLTYIHD